MTQTLNLLYMDMKTLHCMGKICENVAMVLQKRYNLTVAIL